MVLNFTYLKLCIYTKTLFTVFKCNSNNDIITVVALLFISVMLTLGFAFISSKLRISEFKLGLPTKIFLLCKVILILYILINNAIGIHAELMASILHIWLTYILPLFIGNELLTLSMNASNPSGGGG